MKIYFIFLLSFSLLFTVIYAKKHEESSSKATDEEFKGIIKGAIRLGPASNIIVPDSSSEHPLVLSNVEQQPLCMPNKTIKPLRELTVMSGYEYFVLTNLIINPKKIIMDKANHLLVMSPSHGVYSVRMDKCGNSKVKQILKTNTLEEPLGIGMELYNQFLYISTLNSIYQFPYSDGQHSSLGESKKVVSYINSGDATQSSDIAINPFGHAFISRMVSKVDTRVDSSHAVIKRFNFHTIPQDGYDFENDGQVFAYGANTQGLLTFDAQAQLWGINGISNIAHENPSLDQDLSLSGYAEELNKYSVPQKNYGFPYCLTEYKLNDLSKVPKGLGAQWGHPEFMNSSVSLNDYCQDTNHNAPPVVPLAPKSHAVNSHFYNGMFCSVGDSTTEGTSVGLPCNWTNTPIIANHGLAGQPVGHNVVHLPFNDLGHNPRLDKKMDILLKESKPCDQEKCFSPFGLAFDGYGRLFISSDKTNEIIVFKRTFSETAAQKLTDVIEKSSDDKSDDDEKKDEKDKKRDENDDDD